MIKKLFGPRAKALYIPLLPDYLRLEDGSTDLDWVIKYKKRPWSRWKYYSDSFGIPINFYKRQADKMVQFIKEGKIEL